MCVPEYLLMSLEPCKALRPPGTGACKLPEVGSRTEPKTFVRARSALNCQTMFSAKFKNCIEKVLVS